MRKLFLILGFIGSLLFSETIFDVLKTDNQVITGYLIEDNPGESVVIETLEGEIVVISYEDLLLIRVKSEGQTDKIIEIEPNEIEEILPVINDEKDLPKEETIVALSYNVDDLSYKLQHHTLFSLSDLELDSEILNNTAVEVRNRAFETNKKGEVLNYTLLNIIPGLGSILQGDYYSAAYTIGSVLGALAYNAGDGFGTDYYFIINLNGLIAYTASFFAPYRFNNTYNSLLKEKLDIE